MRSTPILLLILISSLFDLHVRGQSPEANGDKFDFNWVRDGFEDDRVFVPGSNAYTDLNWLPGGELVLTEKDGRILVFPDWQDGNFLEIVAWDGRGTFKIVGKCAVPKIPSSAVSHQFQLPAKVCTENERGLHSFTLHPNFEKNRWVYLFYTYREDGSCAIPHDEPGKAGPVNRVSRFTMNDSFQLQSEKVLISTVR